MLGKDVSKKIADLLLKSYRKYFKENFPGVHFPKDVEIILQVPRDSSHGDLTSNIAMRLASIAKCSPSDMAKGALDLVRGQLEEMGVTCEAKGGFSNFKLSDAYYTKVLLEIYKEKADYGRSSEGCKKHINLEFVSANPTGPLTIAHGRQAAIGDALSRILKFNGYKVTNEYYLNDTGRQISLLGESVGVRYRNLFGKGEPMPEDGYMGSYIIDIAEEIKAKKGDKLLIKSQPSAKFFREYAVRYIMGLIVKDLTDFGVTFDTWTSQGRMEKKKEVEKALKILKEAGYIYESEGAKWFSSTRLGDDKDRVVVKSDGSFTYLAPDIAYHLDKYERGYTRLIDLLGPDHHGYIRRMKAAVQAMGRDAKSLDILIVQLVTLMRAGEAASMSTRKGEFISLREILDEVGKDVTRFFFLSRRLDSHLDFDIELAKKESQDNPVFYIQYAHARICSIKRYSTKNRFKLMLQKKDLNLLTAKEEKQLMRKLSEFPITVKASADLLEPNRLIVYLNELSRLFHSFYTECRVVSDDAALSKSRLFLVECVRIVLANGLNLLNITLPEKM